jgi:5-hydroxyisourate hydrolase
VSTLSTHVLDTALGKPAAGVRVMLHRGAEQLGTATTDRDGRAKDFTPTLKPGTYTLSISVGEYFSSSGRDSFYDVVRIDFKIAADQHYHVPLLISPFGYSTYRGS